MTLSEREYSKRERIRQYNAIARKLQKIKDILIRRRGAFHLVEWMYIEEVLQIKKEK